MTVASKIRWTLTFRHGWREMMSSFWFVPFTIVLAAVGLAAGLILVDANVHVPIVSEWPLLFGAGAAGSRGLLTAVATSMITVAGVVFSITIVALSLTSSQYTSRVLRNFMRDRLNQVVLGVFVGIFAYCLVVLRTIRSGEEGAFVPSLAVMVGLLLAFVGIAFLIGFIHHIAIAIQASSIIAAAAQETLVAIDHLFPAGLGQGSDNAEDERPCLAGEHDWSPVAARVTGYIESVDGDALLAFAREHDVTLKMERGVGEFSIEGTPLLSIAGPATLASGAADDLNGSYLVSRQRSVYQDAGFGIRQIVDMALKALSPGMNDSTTAVMCIDALAAILVRLTARDIPSPHRFDAGRLRLIARGPSFESLLAEAFDQIRRSARGNVAVLSRLLQSLEAIAATTTRTQRRVALRRQVVLVSGMADETVDAPDSAALQATKARLLALLDSAPLPPD